jgi:hypothetical protein
MDHLLSREYEAKASTQTHAWAPGPHHHSAVKAAVDARVAFKQLGRTLPTEDHEKTYTYSLLCVRDAHTAASTMLIRVWEIHVDKHKAESSPNRFASTRQNKHMVDALACDADDGRGQTAIRAGER